MSKLVVKKIKKKDHPSLDIVTSKGVELIGKKIVLCVAGSVAAYKAIELARLLMRHGADVTCVTSNAVTKLIQPDYFKWATGNEVITKLTGELEHIRLADYKQSDLVIVYPATANTLGKLANGIDDTPVSTVLTVGFGSKIPILMCLAMHESMYDNLAVKKNIEFLKNKIQFVNPQMVEGKAKAPEPEDVLEIVLKKFGFSSVLKNKKILITAGPTLEYIDPVRVITNISSGKTGVLLASELISAGAKVTIVYGPGNQKPSKGAKVINVTTSKEMFDITKKELKKKFDVVIMAAAASDYTPESVSKSKIKSDKKCLTIRLKKVPKIIEQVKKLQKDTLLVGFKAESNITKSALIKSAQKKMKDVNADIMIANDIGSKYQKNPDRNQILIIDNNKIKSSGWKQKEKIVKLIRKEIEQKLK
ncbi:MAG: bifunctional phosphopantothenoylcysteine decarboxylase/phosphopantothenate--cysteine ligase CoaBC [Nitrosopumilus sp.]|uniref:Coenzyme A biosynthesis bifunctional protein CoaBC n=1 Tax=Nitrosopumilus zosterae TaxID=718286 RepID=A0A2S2KTE0_9ARCH|nr:MULTISPECIES: bifunctional phosphopantothenoylcysteine decarboxylase/phosphopantothenate--cysteine ligase CoaBC [Nitrosopumilus]MCV0365788.1 bifunctional phosphopantothenoylcysteine decarboxylase/phosphopantothenate--cysteine ligase CoaBC [Nitrosopumilus sp.]BDQ29999.1 bifunctional phosphopantothenoylcysteine decarboxylase/phosphopantothenate--cysteine ligase CoaBC [Nitrosopumilus zosterae]GBH34899.1 phosphopantothenoylcysteine decarboxylase [Nitrosopumilus zosterae]